MKPHEKLWTTGFAISGTAACCLDSTGWVQAFAAAAFIAGLAIVGAGFLKRKRACHRPKLHAQMKPLINSFVCILADKWRKCNEFKEN